jgi:integrase
MIEAQHPGLPSGWIFPTWGAKAGKSEERAGELHVGNPFNDALRRACERAGIQRITPHGLRHTGNDSRWGYPVELTFFDEAWSIPR